jgi:hypothetical protein
MGLSKQTQEGMKMTQAEIRQINSELKIVRLNGVKFYDEKHESYIEPHKVYCFYHDKHGYLSFKADNRKGEPKCPYIPIGGKKGLERILAHGGFLQFDDVEWLAGRA